MNEVELEKAFEYINSLRTTKYFETLQAMENHLISDGRDWNPEVTDTDNTQLALDVYRHATGLFERGFPLLLGFKQLLCGESPDIEQLQSMRASKVRRKLQEDGPGETHVYFDKIVSVYENDLRNGIAHGDIIMEPTTDELLIPSEDTSYSYEEVSEIGREAYAASIFLAGVFPNLIVRENAIELIDPISSPPEWFTSAQ